MVTFTGKEPSHVRYWFERHQVRAGSLGYILTKNSNLDAQFDYFCLFSKQFKIVRGRLLWVFPLVHLITFPVTQYLSFSWGHLAEVFPIIAETWVYVFVGVFTVNRWQNFAIVAVV